jgi:hypothetical protein
VSLPPDWDVPKEFVWARLKYQSGGGFGGFGGGGGRRRGGGGFGGGWERWATDYNKGDRHIIQALKRLTLVDPRSVEQVVEPDDSDDIYNWPFLYAVEPGGWYLDEAEAKKLRDYIDRGGFFMTDDFHCQNQWEGFMESFQEVFPDRDVVDIDQTDPINRVLFEISVGSQIPGRGVASRNRGGDLSECGTGEPGHWRGVYDEKKRLVSVIVHNSDLGDAIEYADDPYYPAEYAQEAFRILSNYIVYDLSH